jgi:hypothetical protein
MPMANILWKTIPYVSYTSGGVTVNILNIW